jgi:hypothetical protein
MLLGQIESVISQLHKKYFFWCSNNLSVLMQQIVILLIAKLRYQGDYYWIDL